MLGKAEGANSGSTWCEAQYIYIYIFVCVSVCVKRIPYKIHYII